jgi:hypothetical protein
VKRDCTPHNLETGCAVALLCQRCHLCFIHCTCPPKELRAKDATLLGRALRHIAAIRRIPFHRSER